MGREVRRVPLDFDWPLKKVWEGFLSPDHFDGTKCQDCENGYSPHAEILYNLWYGRIPFDPVTTGSVPFTYDSPEVRRRAERNVSQAPDYYGTGEQAIVREGQRLADLFNARWCHHLAQEDVDALVEEERLMNFTHTWSREEGWQRKDPFLVPTAAEVNSWSVDGGFGHDSTNAHVAVKARCRREGFDPICPTCQGHVSLEAYPGQREEAKKWEKTDPPTGDGWQLWETVSEGSPVSPVFSTADDLAEWMADPARGPNWVPPETARKFIDVGWSPTGVSTAVDGYTSGVEFLGWNDE